MSTPDGGVIASKALLEQENRPTALFCYNDRMAMGAYQVARDHNISIPNRFSCYWV